jgi:hypothetical protein
MNKLKRFNESDENLNSDTSSSISDVSRSFTIEDLRKAFNDGQKSIEIKMKQKPSYDEYGDMVITLIADKETNKNFDAWYRENYL